MEIPVRVEGELFLDLLTLPDGLADEIKAALTFPNEEREKASSENVFGWWDMPETIALWRVEARRGGDNLLCLPRGFASYLVAGCAAKGHQVVWEDHRSRSDASAGYFRPFALRGYQFEAVQALLRAEQGFYMAPAGCVAGDTLLRFNRAGKGFQRDIANAYKRFHGLLAAGNWDRSIPTYCRALVDGVYRQHLVEDIVYSGVKPVIEIELESGKKITCTREHGVLAKDGWLAAGEIEIGMEVTVNGHPMVERGCVKCGERYHESARPIYPSNPRRMPGHCPACRGQIATASITRQIIKDKDGYLQERAPGHPRANSHNRVYQHILVAEAMLGRSIGLDEHVHHRNQRKDDNWPDNLEVVTPAQHSKIHRGFLKMDGGTAGRGGKIVFLPKYERVVAVRDAGSCETYDMVMQDPHNNFVANGIVVHNSGKTATMLGLSAYANQRTLVVVDKAGLLEQWRERAVRFLDLSTDFDDERSTGKIGEDVWVERDLTIALRQTLWSRAWELDATKWWRTWGNVIFDEGHHLSSETLGEIARKVTAHYVFGTSATPAKSETRGKVVHSLVGPIVHETPRQILYDLGVLMKPEVEVQVTDLEAIFWSTHTVQDGVDCEVPSCKKKGTHQHRNNYSSVIKKLVESKDRNKLIAERICSERGHVHLIPSRQLKHLELLKKACVAAGWDGPIYMLRGEENARGESQTIARAVEESHEALVFSTVADEGLDIPPIDRIHIVFPMRQHAALIQLVGRVERVAEGKNDALIIDYYDSRVDVFSGQFSERSRVYRATYKVRGPEHQPECVSA